MTISFYQKILILLVRLSINFLWALDSITLDFSFLRVFTVRRKKALLFAGFLAETLVLIFLVGYVRFVAQNYFSASMGSYSAIGAWRPLTSGTPFLVSKKPELVNNISMPNISAKSVYAFDKKTSTILFDKKSSEAFAPASTTKLMTALVALDIFSPEKQLKVPELCTQIDGSKTGFPANTEVRAKDLLYALLISSSGDAACTLANGSGSYSDFVWRMNRKASQIGMMNTFFTNPMGLDETNGTHRSTAKDLYKLAVAATQNPIISDAVRSKEYFIKSVDESFYASLVNTNKLLWEIPQSVGIKTGTTAAAGEVLIYEYLDEKKDIVIVVMGSEDRFSDTRTVLNWILASYSWN